MLKTGLLALVAGIASSGVASAEDWSGFYVGGDLGYSSGDASSKVDLSGQWTIESTALQSGVRNLWSTDLEPDGTSFGVHAGINHQLSNNVVFGGEVGYEYMDVSASRLSPQTATPAGPSPTYAPGNSVEAKGAFSARAKLGYSFENLLGYVTLGYSTVDVDASAEVISNGGYTKKGVGSDWVGGLSYGLGAEFKLSEAWSMRGEYQRVELDEISFATAYRAGSTFVTPPYNETVTQDLELNTIRIGVNYNF
jgi:outer membrane immunogenic protein